MLRAYVDESGDRGSSPTSTDFFVVNGSVRTLSPLRGAQPVPERPETRSWRGAAQIPGTFGISRSQATSRHHPAPLASALGTPWRFKSSHPHLRLPAACEGGVKSAAAAFGTQTTCRVPRPARPGLVWRLHGVLTEHAASWMKVKTVDLTPLELTLTYLAPAYERFAPSPVGE
jgi:hypothetical protein